jgi:hypothetical protein
MFKPYQQRTVWCPGLGVVECCYTLRLENTGAEWRGQGLSGGARRLQRHCSLSWALPVNCHLLTCGVGIETASVCGLRLPGRHTTWSHTSSHFCFGYSEHRISLFAQVGLDHSPPILWFLLWPGWQAYAITSSFFPVRWDLSNYFFAQLT